MKNVYISVIIVLAIVVGVMAIMLFDARNSLENTLATNSGAKTEEKEEEVNSEDNLTQETNMSEENNTPAAEKIAGLDIKILKEGNGAAAANGQTVVVHYTGKLQDGTIFDSSHNRNKPFEFLLGAGMVIQGWEKGVLGMKIGETRELTIASDLAYGDRGVSAPDGTPVIPGGATLIFEVELLGLK